MGRLADHFRAIIAPEAVEPAPAAKPNLRVLPRNAPSEDEFDAWKDDPVTQFVLGALAVAADEQKDEWVKATWGTGEANPILLHELRTRADAYRVIADSDYTAFCETLGLDPRT